MENPVGLRSSIMGQWEYYQSVVALNVMVLSSETVSLLCVCMLLTWNTLISIVGIISLLIFVDASVFVQVVEVTANNSKPLILF
jgi:hypothetical protein